MTTDATTMALRRCIGSTKFGIEAHDALTSDFPVQASQKAGLGRMCKPHWTEYTRALRKAATGKAAAAPAETIVGSDGKRRLTLEGAERLLAGIAPVAKPGQARKPRTAPEPIRTLPARTRKPRNAAEVNAE